ncbi:hypothetical protein LQ564_04185 [Massilia sp. G4R7]|uniref:RNA polymerase sigma-70 region 4 domain-containing protein n=1 Tax=Massilia phyllostachyos TaxID=2898585 RepID=A0ABS8Q3F6_9BURK|nr:hypothetical protein [Massilia phyllostachyos]MCD2515506.1 hypothetical protein [Massilia phyllostachyos]
MAKQDEHQRRIEELERQVKGLQRQTGILHAKVEMTTNKQERRIRDLEIKAHVAQGVPQTKVAKVYQLSPGRVNQIVKKLA